MGIVIGLFYQTKFLPLVLVEPALHTVGFLEPLQAQDEKLGVMFVGERRKRDRGEASALQPVHGSGVDGNTFLS